MKNLYAFLFVFVTCFINNWSAQETRFQLIDEINNIPVKYANIKAEKSDFGTSSDSLGNFTFDRKENIIINAVGYELKSVNLESTSSKILLAPKETMISEVVIQKPKNKNEIVVDEFKTRHINSYYGLGAGHNNSWIIGNFFENKNYKSTFLKNLTIYTSSEVKNAKFNIRIYAVNENNEPTNEIYSQNIIGYAKKGSHKTTIDLSTTNLKIPKNGVFIAVDWIKTEENLYEYNYTMKGERGKKKGKSYTPSFGCLKIEDNKKTLIFEKEQWSPSYRDKKDSNKFWSLAMELILTD